MKIVITDLQTVTNGDLPLDNLKKLGEVVTYPLTDYSKINERIKDADAIICNKTKLNSETLCGADNLKYIGLFATGYDNIDIAYANSKNITVCNAGAYSTFAVAQHTFAFILEHYNNISRYNNFVQQGGWQQSKTFSPFVYPLNELCGKTIGIVGFGAIGKQVAKLAAAFGMQVLAYSRSGKSYSSTTVCSLNYLLSHSDIVTVHCPLNSDSYQMFNADSFAKFKTGAYFINTARGAIVNSDDLVTAVKQGKLSGAAIDVLDTEPMQKDCPLIGVENITVTPHVAWAPIETRLHLMDIVADNLAMFLQGCPKNTVN